MSSRSPTTIRPPVREWTMLSIPSRSAPPGATTSRALSSRGSWRSETREAHPQAAMTSPSRMAKTALECGLAESRVDRSGLALSSRSPRLKDGMRRWMLVVLRGCWRRRSPATAGSGRALGVADEGPGEHGAERAEARPGPRSSRRSRRRSEWPSPSRAWKTAPVAARATAPASTRSIASTPEAIPTFSPRHRRHRRGRHRRVDEAERDPEQQVAGEQQARRSCRRSIRVRTSRPAVPQAMPAVISRRAPKRPISRPEKGEMKTIGTVIGRISSPLSDRRVAAHVLQVLRLEEHHRPVGADQGEGGGAGAEVGPVAEQREVDDRVADPVLDRARRRRARASPTQRPRTATAAAAPGPRLDQRQDDRGQPDAERQQPGPVDPACRRRGRSTRAPRAAVITIPSAATGRLIQKITRQSSSIRTPPTSGPIASATAETAGPDPERPRLLAGGEGVADERQRERQHRRRADPLQDPAGISIAGVAGGAGETEPSAKTTMPTRKTRLRPNMSPSRPAVTTRTAITSR